MRKQDKQEKLEAEKLPSLRSEQELKSMLNAMAKEDRRELVAALKDWLHE